MIISNSSPIILLSKINKVDVLKEIYGKVFIPYGVYNEAVTQGKEERYGDAAVVEKKIDDFIFVKALNKNHKDTAQSLMSLLGKGEAESIALCEQEKSGMLLMDDWRARKIAESKGIVCRSTLGVLLEALKKNIITLQVYENSIKDLARYSWLSGDVVVEFLQAGYKLKGGRHESRKG